MKMTKLFTLLSAGSLLLSASAFAGPANKKSIRLFDPVTVEGKQLPPGTYTVEWTGSGPNVDLNIIKGKETVAKVSAHVVPTNNSNGKDGYTLKTESNGSRSISDIFFSGQKYDLQIQQASSADASQGASPTGKN